jgi:hypothetical protein
MVPRIQRTACTVAYVEIFVHPARSRGVRNIWCVDELSRDLHEPRISLEPIFSSIPDKKIKPSTVRGIG